MNSNWLRKPTGDTTVIFLHGLLSNGETCWRDKTNAYWPALVAAEVDLADCGVYVFTYLSTPTSGSYSIGDAVDALWEFMRLDGVVASRRLVFVCHSMGGIVARRLIVKRAIDLIEAHAEIALFLVASPSLGSDYANMLSAVINFFGQQQAEAMRFDQSNAWLNDLDKDFLNLKEKRNLSISGKELLEDHFFFAKRLFRNQVVLPFSGAKYFGDAIKIPDSDHCSIAKPASVQAFQHRLLVEFLMDHANSPRAALSARKKNPANLLQQLRQSATSPNISVRLGTIAALCDIRKGSDAAAVAEAELLLQALSLNDSRSVSEAAKSVLLDRTTPLTLLGFTMAVNDRGIDAPPNTRMCGLNELGARIRPAFGPIGIVATIGLDELGIPIRSKNSEEIAEALQLSNQAEREGAQMLRGCGLDTRERAGDGSKLAMILAQSMLREAANAVRAGNSLGAVRKGMENAVKALIGSPDARAATPADEARGELLRISCPLRGRLALVHMALSVCAGDHGMAEAVAKAVEIVGADGPTHIEAGSALEHETTIVSGTCLPWGYLSPYFVTNELDQTAELDRPFILITAQKIVSLVQILPIVEEVQRRDRELLIISRGLEGDTLAALVVNKVRRIIRVVAVSAPAGQDNALADLAELTGARIVGATGGVTLDHASVDDLGTARHAVVDQTRTIILASPTAGRGEESIDYTQDKMTGGYTHTLPTRVAKICVSGRTEVEMAKNLKMAREALRVLAGAIQSGIVGGGGVGLFVAAQSLNVDGFSTAHRAGADVLRLACQEPLLQLVMNAGGDHNAVANAARAASNALLSYNVESGNLESMENTLIADSISVLRTAIEQSSQLALSLLVPQSRAQLSQHPQRLPEFSSINSRDL
jgi:chaperonin GroEL (HSP60 family)/pimeloyl-ACP methyl ester carboxylesterase